MRNQTGRIVGAERTGNVSHQPDLKKELKGRQSELAGHHLVTRQNDKKMNL
jgi:hypothetical protein